MKQQDNLHWEEIAREAAVIGGQVLLDYFGRVSFKSIIAKHPGDWVSEADKGSEKAILEYLADVAPSHKILTEEAGVINNESGSEFRWIIDPLDGTTNYLRGFPIWAVSVALEYKENPQDKWGNIIAGAVYVPLLSEVFVASRGNGAKRNNVLISPERNDRPFKDCLLATGFPFRTRKAIGPYNSLFGEVLGNCADVRRPGAVAVDFCYTATNIFDAFWELDLAPWDIAAGALIMEESGVVVSDFQGSNDYLTTGDIVAGTDNIHKGLLELVIKHFPTKRDVDKSVK